MIKTIIALCMMPGLLMANSERYEDTQAQDQEALIKETQRNNTKNHIVQVYGAPEFSSSPNDQLQGVGGNRRLSIYNLHGESGWVLNNEERREDYGFVRAGTTNNDAEGVDPHRYLVDEGVIQWENPLAEFFFEGLPPSWMKRIENGEFYELALRDFQILPKASGMEVNSEIVGEEIKLHHKSINLSFAVSLRYVVAMKDDDGNYIKKPRLLFGLEGWEKGGTNEYVFISDILVSADSKITGLRLNRVLANPSNGLQTFGQNLGKLNLFVSEEEEETYWTADYTPEKMEPMVLSMMEALLMQPGVVNKIEKQLIELGPEKSYRGSSLIEETPVFQN